jgi:small-conductance mechanosensitive channel
MFELLQDSRTTFVLSLGIWALSWFLMNLMLRKVRKVPFISALAYAFASRLVRLFWILGLILILTAWMGVDLTSVWQLLSAAFVMVAIGFVAVWSLVSHILGAFLLVVLRPFDLGDVIELKEVNGEHGIKGRVMGVSLFFTQLNQELGDGKSVEIKIPNNIFFQKIIVKHNVT